MHIFSQQLILILTVGYNLQCISRFPFKNNIPIIPNMYERMNNIRSICQAKIFNKPKIISKISFDCSFENIMKHSKIVFQNEFQIKYCNVLLYQL